MVKVGQKVQIVTSRYTANRRVQAVYDNGRIKIRGKVGVWYEEEPGLFRNWNNPGYVSMVAVIETAEG